MTNESRPSKYFYEGALIFTLCVLHCGEIWLAVPKYRLQLYTWSCRNVVYICFKRIFFLSDPLYTLSSDRDHARATFKAHTGTDRIVSLKYDVHSSIALIFRVLISFGQSALKQWSSNFIFSLSTLQKRVPHFKTMFSDLRHYPRYSIHLEVTDPVPKFIPRQWRGYADQDREALIRYTK